MGFLNIPRNDVTIAIAYILVIFGSLNIRDWINTKYKIPLFIVILAFFIGFEILTPRFFKNGT